MFVSLTAKLSFFYFQKNLIHHVEHYRHVDTDYDKNDLEKRIGIYRMGRENRPVRLVGTPPVYRLGVYDLNTTDDESDYSD